MVGTVSGRPVIEKERVVSFVFGKSCNQNPTTVSLRIWSSSIRNWL